MILKKVRQLPLQLALLIHNVTIFSLKRYANTKFGYDDDYDSTYAEWSEDGHSGPGWYVWDLMYPEDGSYHFDTSAVSFIVLRVLIGMVLK